MSATNAVQTPTPPAQQPNVSQKTSFHPMIFTPFNLPPLSAPNTPKPSQATSLRNALTRLDAHHDAARRNFFHLVGVERDRIVEEAKVKKDAREKVLKEARELRRASEREERMEDDGEQSKSESGSEEETEKVPQKELDELFKRMNVVPKHGRERTDLYLWSMGEIVYPSAPKVPPIAAPSATAPVATMNVTRAADKDREGDITMGGMESRRGSAATVATATETTTTTTTPTAPTFPLTAAEERTKTARAVQTLLKWAAQRLKAYDVHAAASRKKLEDALARELVLHPDGGAVVAAAIPSQLSSTAPASSGIGARRASAPTISTAAGSSANADDAMQMDDDGGNGGSILDRALRSLDAEKPVDAKMDEGLGGGNAGERIIRAGPLIPVTDSTGFKKKGSVKFDNRAYLDERRGGGGRRDGSATNADRATGTPRPGIAERRGSAPDVRKTAAAHPFAHMFK